MKHLKLTTLRNILDKYNLDEYKAGSALWEMAQEDTDEHYFAIDDFGELYIIDGDLLQDTTSAFHEGAVYHFSR